MTAQTFSADVRHVPEISTIDLRGEINGFAEQALNTAYAQAEEYAPKFIVLNFTQVSYMNSTGIALIVSLLVSARKSHRQIVVYGLSEHYDEIFRITRLADFMEIYPDEASVLAGVVQN